MDAYSDLMSEVEDTRTREHKSHGKEFTLKCSDPYGFWTIHPRKGPVPQELSGQYTSFYSAEKAATAYATLKAKPDGNNST